MNFFERIDKYSCTLSKGQAKLAEYLMKEYKEAVFLQSIPLGKKVGVSEATVVRLSHSLGYKGFTDMIRDIQEYIKNEITTIDKLESMGSKYTGKSALDETMYNNQLIIKAIRKYVNNETISNVTNLMRGKRIIVAGFESEACSAQYMAYYLSRLVKDICIISNINDDLINAAKKADENTLLFSFAFPRYSDKIVRVCRFFKRKNAKIVSFTDSILSPVKPYSDLTVMLPVHDSYTSNIDVMAGIITICQSILLEYGTLNYKSVEDNLQLIEDFNTEFDIFNK